MTQETQNKIEGILSIIAKDDELIEQFAEGLEMTENEFASWIDTAIIN